jgi:hypothetical protein
MVRVNPSLIFLPLGTAMRDPDRLQSEGYGHEQKRLPTGWC